MSDPSAGHAGKNIPAFSIFGDGTHAHIVGAGSCPPSRIQNYEITGLIGRGGMGIVYQARQDNPQRLVALKVMSPGLTSMHHLRRFMDEAHILGRLEHAGIARVYEAGTWNSAFGPQPFIAMEFVDGISIDAFVRNNCLSRKNVLVLFLKLCDAVQVAHQNGVIHRDLKPANILVDRRGEPKILDFGVARVIEGGVTAATESGQLLGTLAYMSPEQATGDTEAIDIRADVYSLGVLLFQLLANRLPLDIEKSTVLNALQQITKEEPAKLAAVDPALKGDLEFIVGKALEKDRKRRYASCAELALDIRRYLNSEPISARAPTLAYRCAKFARRNHTWVVGIACVIVVLIIGIVGTTWEAIEARKQAREAERQSAESTVSTADAELMANNLEEAQDHYVSAWNSLEALHMPSLRASIGLLRADALRQPPVVQFQVNKGGMTNALLLADGTTLVSTGVDHNVRIWNAKNQQLLAEFENACGVLNLIAASKDRVAFANDLGLLRIVDVKTLRTVKTVSLPPERVSQLAFPPDGTSLVCGYGADTFTWCSIDRDETPRTIRVLYGVDLVVREKTFLTAHQDGTIDVVDLLDNRPTVTWKSGFDRLSNLVDLGGNNVGLLRASTGEFQIIDLSNHKLLSRYNLGPGHIVAFLTASNHLLFCTAKELREVDAFSGKLFRVLATPMDSFLAAPQSGIETIAIGNSDGSVAIWPKENPAASKRICGTSTPSAISSTPDGLLVATLETGIVRLWSGFDFHPLGSIDCKIPGANWMLLSPDGSIVTVGAFSSAAAIDVATGKELWHLGSKDMFGGGHSISPDSKYLFLRSDKVGGAIFDLRTGVETSRIGHNIGSVEVSTFVGDDFIFGMADGSTSVWHPKSNTCVSYPDREPSSCEAFGVSADQKEILEARTGNRLSLMTYPGMALLGNFSVISDFPLMAKFSSISHNAIVVYQNGLCEVVDLKDGTKARINISSETADATLLPEDRLITVGSDGIYEWDLNFGTDHCQMLAARTARNRSDNVNWLQTNRLYGWIRPSTRLAPLVLSQVALATGDTDESIRQLNEAKRRGLPDSAFVTLLERQMQQRQH